MGLFFGGVEDKVWDAPEEASEDFLLGLELSVDEKSSAHAEDEVGGGGGDPVILEVGVGGAEDAPGCFLRVRRGAQRVCLPEPLGGVDVGDGVRVFAETMESCESRVYYLGVRLEELELLEDGGGVVGVAGVEEADICEGGDRLNALLEGGMGGWVGVGAEVAGAVGGGGAIWVGPLAWGHGAVFSGRCNGEVLS